MAPFSNHPPYEQMILWAIGQVNKERTGRSANRPISRSDVKWLLDDVYGDVLTPTHNAMVSHLFTRLSHKGLLRKCSGVSGYYHLTPAAMPLIPDTPPPLPQQQRRRRHDAAATAGTHENHGGCGPCCGGSEGGANGGEKDEKVDAPEGSTLGSEKVRIEPPQPPRRSQRPRSATAAAKGVMVFLDLLSDDEYEDLAVALTSETDSSR